MKPGKLFHLPLFTGLALFAYGLRLRFRFAEQESCQGYVIPVLGSTRLRRRLVTLLLMWTAGCVDGYAGFQRIFRMGTLRQLGRQRSCRDMGPASQAAALVWRFAGFPEASSS